MPRRKKPAALIHAEMPWATAPHRWVANHPGLSADREYGPVRTQIKAYELAYPCPSQYARNLYEHCELAAARGRFFDKMAEAEKAWRLAQLKSVELAEDDDPDWPSLRDELIFMLNEDVEP